MRMLAEFFPQFVDKLDEIARNDRPFKE